MLRPALPLAFILLAAPAPLPARPLPLPERTKHEEATTRLEASAALPQGSSTDTVWFGATIWAADSGRWEAAPGGLWTFDTGTASHFNHELAGERPKDPSLHAQMEGWIGSSFDPAVLSFFRRVSEAAFGGAPTCVGNLGGLGGDYSLWAGVLPDEADSLMYAFGGPGYGNNWAVSVRKEFFYPGSGSVTLQFDYVNRTEADYDFTYVIVDTSGTGDEVTVTSYDGNVSGHASLLLTPGNRLPTSARTIAIRFEVRTDASYSDEDGLYPTTCGAFAVDNISLSGAITTSLMTFEAGAEGWVSLPTPWAKDWSDIVSLSLLPPVQGPACGLQDSVLVFRSLDAGGLFENNQKNAVVSPWIDLSRAGLVGRRGKVLELDFNTKANAPVVLADFGVQSDPCIDPITFEENPGPVTRVFLETAYTMTGCFRLRFDLSHAVPLEAEKIRVAVGISTFSDAPFLNNTPWFDNIRLGVFGEPVALPPAPEPPPTLLTSWSTLLPGDASTEPAAIAVDAYGHVYVSDSENQRIQKYTADGVLLDSWAGWGSGLDVAPDGSVYVARDRVYQFTAEGVPVRDWALPGGCCPSARGAAVDDAGLVYVSSSNGKVFKFTGDGSLIGSWSVGNSVSVVDIEVAGGRAITLNRSSLGVVGAVVSLFTTDGQLLDSWGKADPDELAWRGADCAGRFFDPQGLAITSNHEIFVSDRFTLVGSDHRPTLLSTDRIHRYTAEGAFLSGWLTSPGHNDLTLVQGLAVSPGDHRLYAVDQLEGLVKVYALSSMTAVPEVPPAREAVILGAHPNPFSTDISLVLRLPTAGNAENRTHQVDALLFDSAGRRVRTLHSGPLPSGDASFRWDGRNDAGVPTAAGIYFFRVQVDGRVAGARKIVRVE